MIPKYTPREFDTAKPTDKLSCECEYCHHLFTKEKRYIKRRLASPNHPLYKHVADFCSEKCRDASNKNKVDLTCDTCGNSISKVPSQIHPHNFCSQSCAATYQNTHKTTGIRRSKLEKYLEEQLALQYPSLEIHYNKTDAINSELDIYIPSLKLAFELNGIFHYEPIFGAERLSKIQNNDQRKFQACLERGIEMCSIDASGFKNFKPDKALKYLHIILAIIKLKCGE